MSPSPAPESPAPESSAPRRLPRRYLIVAVEGISGSGKSAVSRAIERELNGRFTVLRTRLSARAEEAFRGLETADGGDGEAAALAAVVDAAVQFRYLADVYNRHDILIFDGWLPAYYARWPGATWCRAYMGAVPPPDLMFYLKADPRAAALRVARQSGAAGRTAGGARALADLTRLDARYREAMSIWPGHIADGNAPLPQVIDVVLDRIGDLLRSAPRAARPSPGPAGQVRSACRAALARRRLAQDPARPRAR